MIEKGQLKEEEINYISGDIQDFEQSCLIQANEKIDNVRAGLSEKIQFEKEEVVYVSSDTEDFEESNVMLETDLKDNADYDKDYILNNFFEHQVDYPPPFSRH